MEQSGDGRQTSLTLIQRLRANESDAWSRLNALYRPLVVYWCDRQGVRGADAEDICQEVFRVAAIKLPDFRKDRPGDTFRGWLRGITRNKLLAFHRDHQGYQVGVGGSSAALMIQELPDNQTMDDEDDPLPEVSALMRRALEFVRSEFETSTWRAFLLTTVEGRSAPDVAEELKLSSAAVRQAKSRVMRRLKVELGEIE